MGRLGNKDSAKAWPPKKEPAAASQQGVEGVQRETQMGGMLANALGKKNK